MWASLSWELNELPGYVSIAAYNNKLIILLTSHFSIYIETSWNTVVTIFKPGVHRPSADTLMVSWNCFCSRSQYVCVCVSTPEAINYIHVIFYLYNQLNKFVAFRNIMKLSMHGRAICNEAPRNRNQSNKAMLAP